MLSYVIECDAQCNGKKESGHLVDTKRYVSFHVNAYGDDDDVTM